MNKTAVIFGSGFDIPDILSKRKEIKIQTPYGKTSSLLFEGNYKDVNVIFMLRHGENHKLPAFQINYKANLFALQELEVDKIIAISYCGSLQEEICLGEFVIFDQFIDQTRYHDMTFADKLDVKELNHAAFNIPFSLVIRDSLIESAIETGLTVHTKGVVIAMDGPRQSTRAESNLFRSWGADVVNMTTAPEAILAHELGIPYGNVSLCTYYDSWRTDIQPATHDEKWAIVKDHEKKMCELVCKAIIKLSV